MENVRNINILRNVSVPDLSAIQLEMFNEKSLLARRTGKLEPMHAMKVLSEMKGRKTLVADIGGTAAKTNIAVVGDNGQILIDESQESMVENPDKQGNQYLDFLTQAGKKYPNLPVAVSSGGVVEDNNLITNANFPFFVDQLKQAGGFTSVFNQPEVPLMNDAQAGVIAGGVGIAQRDGKAKPVIYIINGGGIGGAFMDRDGNITSMEPGHIEVVDKSLNPNGVQTPCELFPDWKHVCLERIGASGAGIEAQWEALTGEKLPGKDIAEKMYMGDERAKQLYVSSALIVAHIIEGIRNTMNCQIEDVSIVLHGGAFKTEGMVDLIERILKKHHQVENVDLVPTSKLGYSNACMTGLAISALVNQAELNQVK